MMEPQGHDEALLMSGMCAEGKAVTNGLAEPQTGYVEGTFLEAAFVDPAYTWPSPEGEGRNAIELQASITLIGSGDDEAESVDDSPVIPSPSPPQFNQDTVKPRKKGLFSCCSPDPDDVIDLQPTGSSKESYEREYRVGKEKVSAMEVTSEIEREAMSKDRLARMKDRARMERRKTRYDRVPEGILIYRLNTKTHKLTLLSHPHTKTNLDKLVTEMVIIRASPSHEKSRRGINLVGHDGTKTTLVACEQRTAIAWLETLTVMLDLEVGQESGLSDVITGRMNESSEKIQGQYLNLANYSNKLIRSGALPGAKKGSGGAGGIYYTIEIHHDEGGEINEEALESIAKRRAVIKDSWDFYRMICSLLRDKRKYDEVFRRMQLDPVYPYLNSMTGLNDPADGGVSDKAIFQKDMPEYTTYTNLEIAKHLVTKAEQAMPSLVEICKALAGSLGMEEVGLGPTKDVQAAIRKAERKYQGDLLKVTDYCRALLVVKDFPSLLALLELARDSFGPLIRRVKMSALKSDYKPKPGGYRDCIINVELKEHICEIQVHIWPLWTICGVDGFRHYRHCLEYNTDSFQNPYESLEGLSSKTRAELMVMAEEAVVDTPLDNLEWYHEKNILDYFAEVGLFLNHGLDVWAEITLKHLIRLRLESPDIGPDHPETTILYRYLVRALKAQGKHEEAEEANQKVEMAARRNKSEKDEAEQSLWDSFLTAQAEAFDMIMDPNKKEREEEENLRREVKASKKQWRRIRNERFKFLDLNVDPSLSHVRDEKKQSEAD